MLKNEVLMKSSCKLKNKRSKHIQAIEQSLISIDLKFFMNQMKLRYDTMKVIVTLRFHQGQKNHYFFSSKHKIHLIVYVYLCKEQKKSMQNLIK